MDKEEVQNRVEVIGAAILQSEQRPPHFKSDAESKAFEDTFNKAQNASKRMAIELVGVFLGAILELIIAATGACNRIGKTKGLIEKGK